MQPMFVGATFMVAPKRSGHPQGVPLRQCFRFDLSHLIFVFTSDFEFRDSYFKKQGHPQGVPLRRYFRFGFKHIEDGRIIMLTHPTMRDFLRTVVSQNICLLIDIKYVML